MAPGERPLQPFRLGGRLPRQPARLTRPPTCQAPGSTPGAAGAPSRPPPNVVELDRRHLTGAEAGTGVSDTATHSAPTFSRFHSGSLA